MSWEVKKKNYTEQEVKAEFLMDVYRKVLHHSSQFNTGVISRQIAKRWGITNCKKIRNYINDFVSKMHHYIDSRLINEDISALRISYTYGFNNLIQEYLHTLIDTEKENVIENIASKETICPISNVIDFFGTGKKKTFLIYNVINKDKFKRYILAELEHMNTSNEIVSLNEFIQDIKVLR